MANMDKASTIKCCPRKVAHGKISGYNWMLNGKLTKNGHIYDLCYSGIVVKGNA